jgi:hypothetical protein
MAALIILPLTILAGGAADFASYVQLRAELQRALDAAVLAGARAQNSESVALANFQAPLSTRVAVSQPVFSSRQDGGIEGVVEAQSQTAFLSAVRIPHLTMRARASAVAVSTTSDVCLTALGADGPGLVRDGSGDIDAVGCRFDVRSTASPAASFGGNGGRIRAAEICVRGTSVTGMRPSNLQTGCTISQPLQAQLSAPAVGACSAGRTNFVYTDVPMEPGTYCGVATIANGAPATMRPGVYIFRSASPSGPAGLRYSGGGSLTGEGVYIYFASASVLDLGGSGDVRLTAPSSGSYRGVLFHEAAGLPLSEVSLQRSRGGFLRGVILLPSRNLSIGGSGDATIDEVTMLINRLSTGGSGTWTFKPAPSSVADAGFPVLRS